MRQVVKKQNTAENIKKNVSNEKNQSKNLILINNRFTISWIFLSIRNLFKKILKKEQGGELKGEFVDLKEYCRNVGIVLIVFGILHFILPRVLDSSWGAPLIAVGIFSLIFRKRFTLLIYGITFVLVGILNSLPLFSSEVEFGRWSIIGILQIYWGITEFIKFYKIKGRVIESDVKPVFQWLALLVLIIIFLFYIDDHFSSYSIYKTVDGKEVLIDHDSCEEPYVEINYRCCIQSENFTEMCEDEAIEYDAKMQIASSLDKPLTTKKTIIDSTLNISFDMPEGYILIKDTKEGGIKVPYHLITFGVDEEYNYTGDMIDIRIYDYTSISQKKNFWNGVLSDVYSGFDEDMIKDEKTSKGYDIITIEDTGKYDNESRPFLYYQKDIVFKDREIWIIFYANEGLIYKKNDFDHMLDSIVFK